MPWITITEDDVLDRLSDEERDELESVGEEEGAEERLPGIIRQVIALVRGKVAACTDNRGRMGPAGTIPEECLFHATTICREALVASQPTPEGVSDPRKEEIRQAHLFLGEVASCKVAIADQSGNFPGEPVNLSGSCFGGSHCLF